MTLWDRCADGVRVMRWLAPAAPRRLTAALLLLVFAIWGRGEQTFGQTSSLEQMHDSTCSHCHTHTHACMTHSNASSSRSQIRATSEAFFCDMTTHVEIIDDAEILEMLGTSAETQVSPLLAQMHTTHTVEAKETHLCLLCL